MNIVALGILFILAFILQYALTYVQIKSFNKSYTKLRKMGRVVIGRKKGMVRAGAIVMLALDKNDKVIARQTMQGVTVLARFKNYDAFNGLKIREINKDDCKAIKLSTSLTMAVMDGVTTFKTITAGGEVPEELSPFGKLSQKLKIK